MSNLFNSESKPQSHINHNIRLIKIIAIILGILIIVSLTILVVGLTKSYKNVEKSKQVKNNLITKKNVIDKFNFSQPSNSQLISSSLGSNNEILLRYIYEGNNVLVILNSDTKQVSSIITLKNGTKFGRYKD